MSNSQPSSSLKLNCTLVSERQEIIILIQLLLFYILTHTCTISGSLIEQEYVSYMLKGSHTTLVRNST